MRKLFTGIRAKLLLIFLLIGPVPLLAAGLFTVWQSEQSLVRVERNGLVVTVEDTREVIEDWLDAQLGVLQYLAALPEAENPQQGLLREVLAMDDRGAFETIDVILPSGVRQFGIDLSGLAPRQVGNPGSLSVADQGWFQQALAGADTFSAPELRQINILSSVEQYAMHVAVPIRRGQRVVGVVGGMVWLDAVIEHVEQLGLGRQGEVYLIDGQGLPVMDVPSVAAVAGSLRTEAAADLEKGLSGSGVYSNAAGQPVMGAYTPIPRLGWGLLFEVPEDYVLGLAQELGAYLRTALVYFIVVAVVVVVLVGLAAAGGITRPALAIAEATRRVAQGDLTVPALPVDRGDELGDIARNFTQMVQDLRTLIGEVVTTHTRLDESRRELQSSATQSYTASQEITTAISQVADGANAQTASVQRTVESMETWRRSVAEIDEGAKEQRRRVDETNALVEGVAQALQEVAAAAQQVAQAANKDVESAQHGGQAVQATVQGMEQIRRSVTEAVERVQALSVHSQKIGEIIRIIEEIAEHTNLLALNAAIEAARAGEQGRGFAVVAQEVRDLAEHSAKSAQEIGELIRNIHADIGAASSAAAAGLEQVERGSHVALTAGSALEQIISGIAESNRRAHDIAAMAGEMSDESQKVAQNVSEVARITRQNAQLAMQMSEAMNEVAAAMTDISAISEETAAGAQQVAASAEQGTSSARHVQQAADQLGEYAGALDELIRRFKL